jgi:hypothetical protein
MNEHLMDALIDAVVCLDRMVKGTPSGEAADETLEGTVRTLSRLGGGEKKALAAQMRRRSAEAQGDPEDPGLADLLASLPRRLGLEEPKHG